MLILTRKKGETIVIDDNIEITILDAGDGKVKIGIEAPKNIDIHRKEVHESIQEENRQAKSNKKIDLSSLKNFLK